MKAILYAGTLLMAGASVYGFVDFKKTSQKKEFRNMYEHEQSAEASIIKEPAVIPEAISEQKTKPVVKIAETKVKSVSKKENIPAEETEPVLSKKSMPAEKISSEKPDINTSEIKETASPNTSKKITRKKELNHKLFSRAALDEKYLEKDLKTEEKKAEPAKSENKKQ